MTWRTESCTSPNYLRKIACSLRQIRISCCGSWESTDLIGLAVSIGEIYGILLVYLPRLAFHTDSVGMCARFR
jgi:hypothetical protein